MRRTGTDTVATDTVVMRLTAVEGAGLAAPVILACAAQCTDNTVRTGVKREAECIAGAPDGLTVNGATAAGADSAVGAVQCMGIMAAAECTADAGSMADTVIAAGPVVVARWDLTIVDLVVGGKAGRAVASANGAAAGVAMAWADRVVGAAASAAMDRADSAVVLGADRVLAVVDSADRASAGQDSEAMDLAALAADRGARSASVADRALAVSALADQVSAEMGRAVSAVDRGADRVLGVDRASAAMGRADSPADLGTMIARVGRDLEARAPVVAASDSVARVAVVLAAAEQAA